MEISPDLVRAYFLLGNDYKSLRTGQCCFLFLWRDIDNEIVHLLLKLAIEIVTKSDKML